MNAVDIHKYGQSWFLNTLEDLPSGRKIEDSGVCGDWSVKDVVSHIAHYEVMFASILNNFIAKNDKVLGIFESRENHEKIGNEEVEKRRNKNLKLIMEELNTAFEKNQKLLNNITEKDLRKAGTISWYGKEYSLDDLIVYLYYGHKREHGAQINVFKLKLSNY